MSKFCYELEFALHTIFHLILATTLKAIILIPILHITEAQGLKNLAMLHS